ncbi:MAG: PcfJ domain-containing protein [Isosphaeraceae bacterium]
MDAKPKSNKLRRLEKKQKNAARAERQAEAERQAGQSQSARLARAESALKVSKSLRRDPEKLLAVARNGHPVSALPADLRVLTDMFRSVYDPDMAVRPRVEPLRRLVRACHARGDLLSGQHATMFTKGLLALSAYEPQWIRMPEGWAPRTHNAYRQFHSLVRHLLARYDVPTFMNTAWLEGPTREGSLHQSWFLHVAKGENLRTAPGLPVPLTKKQAHVYLQAPCDFDVTTAFRYAQIVDLGGDERLVRSVLATRVGASFDQDEFWLTVFRWLIAQPMLDPAHHGPIIDFLHAQKFVPSVPDPRDPGPGVRRLVPPQPKLTMNGRNPEVLLRCVHGWHRNLGRERGAKDLLWGASGFPAFCFEEGNGESRKVYTLTELTSSRELIDEGRAMCHCVASYAQSCHAGRTSIWSLKLVDAFGRSERLVTVEVIRASRQVVQARKKFNALPTPKELQVLRRWTDTGGPSLSKWVDPGC